MGKLLSLAATAAIFASTVTAQAGGIDVVFEIDESGSMGGAINGVKQNVVTIYDALPQGSHVGLVGYGAGSHGSTGGMYIPHIHTSLTDDKNTFQTAVGQLVVNGGLEPGYRAVYESTTDTVSTDWQGNPNPSLGFTGAPYCNIIITDETLNQGGRTQQEAITAMNDAGGVFFGIIGSNLFSETQPLADATGGQLFDLNQFLQNPQPVIDAVLNACIAAVNPLQLSVDDGHDVNDPAQCIPANTTEITYSFNYENKNQETVEGVDVAHTGGTWGGSSWTWNIGDVAVGSTGSAEVTLPLGTLTPGGTFLNEFTMTSSTPDVPEVTVSDETLVCPNTPPVAQCKDVTLNLGSNGQTVLTSGQMNNGSSDPDGDPITFSLSKTNFGCSDIGTQHAVTLTVTDDGGLSDSCIANVTVVDNTAPDVKTKDITVQLGSNGNASIAADNIDSGSTDNCCIASRTIDKSGFTCSDLGENTVTLTVKDCNGNSSSATATVTVVDTIAPANVQANAQSTIIPPDAPISFTATADDNCSAAVEITDYSCYKVKKNGSQQSKMESCVVGLSGDTITITDSGGVGDNIVWAITATDQSGNTTTAEGRVSVNNPGRSGEKGNNGVGNGEDPQPRGNPPINDGPGTSPGNPGNKGKK